MIVQCDNCKAKFNLADEKVTEKGLKVRCSKCKTVFVARRSQADSSPGVSPAGTVPVPPAPAPGPPPAKPAASAPPADPFSDFTFSDDLDFDRKEETAPPAPVSTERPPVTPSHHDYAPSPPPAAVKPQKAAPAETEDEFNFADEDFAPVPPPPAKPAPPPAAKPAPPPPAAPKSAGSAEEIEFGDFNFDEESFAEAEPSSPKTAPAQAPPAKSLLTEGEWDSVPFSDERPSAPTAKQAPAAVSADDEGFGDFHFDAEGNISAAGGEAAEDELGEFVRAPGSSAAVRDDLEASLETDTETESTPARRPAPAPAGAPGIPAKPVIRHAPAERNLAPWIFLGVVALLVLGLAAGVLALHFTGVFTFQDWSSGNFAKLQQIPQVQQVLIRMGWMEPPDTGTVEVVGKSNEDAFVVRRADTDLLVIKGTVRTTLRKPQSFLRVEVNLFDQNKNLLAQKKGYCDVTFTPEELRTLPLEDIETFLNARSGRNLQNVNVQTGETRDFMVVFYPIPAGVAAWNAKVVSYLDADAADALLQEEATAK